MTADDDDDEEEEAVVWVVTPLIPNPTCTPMQSSCSETAGNECAHTFKNQRRESTQPIKQTVGIPVMQLI